MQNGAANGMNGMHPLMMMTLLDDKTCKSKVAPLFTGLKEADALKIATGEYFFTGTDPKVPNALTGAGATGVRTITGNFKANELAEANKYIDYEYISCKAKSKDSSLSSTLPLMMMGQNNMATMNPLMLMTLVDDKS